MNPTQNVQNQDTTSLQQPRGDLQPVTDGSLSAPNLNQDQLVGPQLKVGDTTIQSTSHTNSTPVSGLHHHPAFILPGVALLLVAVAVLIFWPESKQAEAEPLPEEPTPEPVVSDKPAAPKPKKTTKARPKKSTKRRKAAKR